MTRTLAIDVGGTNFSVAIFDGEKLTAKATRPTDRAAGPVGMMDSVQEMVREIAPLGKFDACGIGFGGPVDFEKQRVFCSTQVPGWEGFDFIREFESRFAVHAVVDRDTMVGALGEGFYGAGKGIRPLFYITVSTGVGGGLLTEHGLYRGKNSYACEVGHHTVLPNGPLCLCGSHGCMERMCSGLWLERDYGNTAENLLKSPEFVMQYVVHLAQGLKNTIMFLNPAMIVLGGGISKAGDALFIPLRKELSKQITSWCKASLDVQPAGLGDESILWGALKLAQLHVHADNRGSVAHSLARGNEDVAAPRDVPVLGEKMGFTIPAIETPSIESLRPEARGVPKVVLFDFDGTLSLLRAGWADVMVPMMVAELAALKSGESEAELHSMVREFVDRLTGKQTIYQMIELAAQVERRGGVPETPLAYKYRYLDLLHKRIVHRLDELRSGQAKPEKYLVPGSIELLQALRKRGMRLYLASGTDEEFMRQEADLLGVTEYFDGGVYGAQDDYKSFSKRILIERILSRSECHGTEILGFGDGYVEIENIKAVGGIAVGVATDEGDCLVVDEWKRNRLAGAGADYIVPNFLNQAELLERIIAS